VRHSVRMEKQLHPLLRIVDHPLVRTNLTRLRDQSTPSEEFRRCLRELTLLMVYEVTREFEVEELRVRTPMEETTGHRLTKPVVVVPILRAALGMAEAVLELIPQASVGHIGMYRDEETHEPRSYYFKQPANLPQAHTLLIDPMLATGQSASAAIDKLKTSGATDITFVCLLCCPDGLATLSAEHPDVPVFCAVVDARLNENAYIIPGLGDAGDRYFGTV